MNLTNILSLNRKRMRLYFYLIILAVGIGTYSNFSFESNNLFYFFVNVIADGWYNFFLALILIFNALSITKEYYLNYNLLIRINNHEKTLEKEVIKSTAFLFLITNILALSSAIAFSGGNLEIITYTYNLPVYIIIIDKLLFQLLFYPIISLIFVYYSKTYDKTKTYLLIIIFAAIFLTKMFCNFENISILKWYEFYKLFLGLFNQIIFANIIIEIVFLSISLLGLLSILIVLKNISKKKDIFNVKEVKK